MRDKISKRVGRVISGSFNAIIDAVENAAPEVVMEEAIREVEGVVEDVRAGLGKVIANKHMANKRLMQANQKHEDLSEKIELAVNEKRDDLAEAAVSQQLDIEAQVPILETQISDLGAQEKEFEGYVSALQGKRREMQDELRIYRESRRDANNDMAGSGTSTPGGTLSHENKVDQANSAFERILGKASGFVAGRTSDRTTAAKISELDDLSRKNRVKERLAAIKEANKE